MDKLASIDAFVELPQHKSIYTGQKVINSVWELKRNIYPDVYLKKHKFRLCVRRGLETEGVDYFDMYSPVFPWLTEHILLNVTCIFIFETKHAGFTLYFVDEKYEPGSFIETPKRFGMEGYVI